MNKLVAKDKELHVTVEQAGEALELEIYCATDDTTKRWEVQEQRLVEQVAELRWKLRTHKEVEDNAVLSGEIDCLQQNCVPMKRLLKLEREELKAYMQARMRHSW